MLEVYNLKKDFYVNKEVIKVIDDISFNVNKREIVAILGPSGAGKSTIFNLISGFIKNDEGTIKINGNIGYMFQKDCLLDYLNVYKNVILPLQLNKKKMSKEIYKERKEEALRLIDKYGLKESIGLYPRNLSGGMKQRVALIRTLIMDPDIILLDEAFSSLDYQTKLIIEQELCHIIREKQKTMIMITHDISEAISMADRIIILSSKPTKIKAIIKLSFKENDPILRRKENNFQLYFDKIWNIISDVG